MFLHILSIIGIVLLCIVAFILLILLLVLFVPVKYKITADGTGSDIEAGACVKWLFGIAHFKADYSSSVLSYKAGVLFFPIFKGSIGKEKEEEPGKKKKKKKEKPDTKEKSEESPADLPEENIRKGKFVFALEKAKKVWEKVKTVKYIWDAPVTKRAISFAKVKIFALLDHIRPRKIEGRVIFGLSAPDTTAQVYALGSILISSLGAGLILEPDLDKENMTINDLDISGRIFIGYMLLLALEIIKNKDIRRVVKYIRRNL